MNRTDIALAELIGLPLYNEVIEISRPTLHWDQMMMIIDRLREIKIKGQMYYNYDQIFNFLNGYHKGPLTDLYTIGQAIIEMAKHYKLQDQAKIHFRAIDLEELKIKSVKKHPE